MCTRHLQRKESELAWEVFEAVHRGRSECDIDGATAELDFRLAVLAQSIDAALPLTRLAAAPLGGALARFAQSAKFRACFEQGARDVTTAFSAGPFKGVLQPARRPSAGPWPLVLLRNDPRIEITEVTANETLVCPGSIQ